MNFTFSLDAGLLVAGPLRLTWYFPDPQDDDMAFVTVGLFDYNLELGQVDQDSPGIYVTKYDEGEVVRALTIARF